MTDKDYKGFIKDLLREKKEKNNDNQRRGS